MEVLKQTVVQSTRQQAVADAVHDHSGCLVLPVIDVLDEDQH